MMAGDLTVADLFCGAGGLSQGFTATGHFRTVFGVDVRPWSIQTFAANHPEALAICKDVRELPPQLVAEQLGVTDRGIDVVAGGPPCQGFSSIRPFRSINENDYRNGLFEYFLSFVGFFRPRFAVFENVVGLQHHAQGKTLRALRDGLTSFGYAVTDGVLNSAHYGVPQKRERMFILGRRGGKTPRLPAATTRFEGRSMGGRLSMAPLPLFNANQPPAATVRDAIYDLPMINSGGSSEEYDETLTASGYARSRRGRCEKLALHSATRHTQRMLEIIRLAGINRWALPKGMTSSGFSSSYSRLSADEPSTTITVNFVHPASNRCIHPEQDRALTPREGARIQSFDDSYRFMGTRTQIVKQIGEAVPPLLAKAVAEALLEDR